MTPEQLLQDASLLLAPKRKDYSEQGIWSNFERSKQLVNWFKNDRDKVYVTLIATKLARIATLLNNNASPNNEALIDSFKDMINYTALWGSDVETNPLPEENK